MAFHPSAPCRKVVVGMPCPSILNPEPLLVHQGGLLSGGKGSNKLTELRKFALSHWLYIAKYIVHIEMESMWPKRKEI